MSKLHIITISLSQLGFKLDDTVILVENETEKSFIYYTSKKGYKDTRHVVHKINLNVIDSKTLNAVGYGGSMLSYTAKCSQDMRDITITNLKLKLLKRFEKIEREVIAMRKELDEGTVISSRLLDYRK